MKTPYARAMKVNDVPKHNAVRLYSESPGVVALQVRAIMRLKNNDIGKDFIVAHASLNVDDLRMLRAAIDDCIERAEVTGASK